MLTSDEFRAACSAEVGKPYIWGAGGPEAWDCSGLVQVLLGRLNLDPPGDQTAEGLYRYFSRDARSTAVALDDGRLGDVVFFGNEAAVSHVALAWGDGQMLEAGGGGRDTTSVAVARKQHAEVRVVPITRRRDRVAILRLSALRWRPAASALEALVGGFGHYDEADPLTIWLSDGRHMQLKRPYAYFAEDGMAWPVPSEAIVDGASIPQPFWSIIGGPFSGLYRNASIIHDFFCDAKTHDWRATHLMFYQAMRCSGVDAITAKIMYYAVYRFGPRWALSSIELTKRLTALEAVTTDIPAPLAADSFDGPSALADIQAIADRDPDIATIEALADSHPSGSGGAG